MARVRRFVLLDNDGETTDRYTLIDTKPIEDSLPFRSEWYMYIGFSSNPYHPQGFGQHGEMKRSDFAAHRRERFRALGKPIKLEDLPEQARKFAKSFMDGQLSEDTR